MNYYTKDQDEIIKKYYISKGRKWCAEQIGKTPSSVKSRANKQLGIKCSKNEIREKQLNWRKERGNYTVNESLFENPASPEVAYLLGFLWADGHLSITSKHTQKRKYKIILAINETDGKIIGKVLNTTGKWTRHIQNKEMGQNMIHFTCANFYIGKFLEKNDYHIKSGASACKILSIIPENLQYYWWRGFFDGDGCLNIASENSTAAKCSIKITSCYNQDWKFLEFLYKHIPIQFNILRKIRKDTGTKFSQIHSSGRINCLWFCHYIYQNYENDKIGLDRKYNKFKCVILDIFKMIKTPHKRDHYWKNPKPELLKMLKYWDSELNLNNFPIQPSNHS